MKNPFKKFQFSPPVGRGSSHFWRWAKFSLWGLGGLLVCSLGACSLLNPVPTTLPPETQEGKNTFGCLVDGKLLVPYSDNTTYDPLSKKLQSPYGGLFRVGGNYYKDKRSLLSCSFILKYIQKTGIYYLKPKRNNPNFEITDAAICSVGEDYYYMLNYKSNFTVEITKFDQKNYIVAGRFYGTLYHEKDSTRKVEITQGRFDVKFE